MPSSLTKKKDNILQMNILTKYSCSFSKIERYIMLMQKKSFKRHLQIIMNKDISKIVQLPLEGGDSLTGKTSLGEALILKLRLFLKITR